MKQFTLYICESQPVAAEGLKAVLSSDDRFTVAGNAADIRDCTRQVAEVQPALILIGQPHSTRSVLPSIGPARDAAPGARVVLWIGEISESDSFRALQLGARGIVKRTSPVPTLIECLLAVGEGNVWVENSLAGTVGGRGREPHARITPREREIVEYVCRGMKNKEIADALSITPGTVKVHLMHIFEKTGVKDRFQLALQGRQLLGGNQPSFLHTAAGSEI